MIVGHEVHIDTAGLTEEQLARLKHHVKVSCQVFEASVKGMLKGVQKYEAEPHVFTEADGATDWRVDRPDLWGVICHWLPHQLSEAVDLANQTALQADELGVDLV